MTDDTKADITPKRRWLPKRVEIHPIALIMGTTVFLLAFDNATFWAKGIEIFSGYQGKFAVLVVAMFFLMVAIMALFGSRKTVKPFLAFLLILSAATSYHMDNLGVIFNRDMIQNIAVTTLTESKHLITFSFLLQIVVWGILPSIVVFWFRLRKGRFWRALFVNSGVFVICLSITVGLLYVNLKTYSSVFRQRKDFLGSHQPGAPLTGAIRYAKLMLRSANVVIKPIGQDAEKGPLLTGVTKPVLTLLVIGETARSQNYSLNGYERDTNPYMSQKPIVNFPDVNSCGTATAVSLPCMFSKFGRGSYSYRKGIEHENLVDVLKYAGLNVEWWDNNTGDKNLADRIKYRSFNTAKVPEFCYTGECNDGIFKQYLQEYADNITQDTVLVLHLAGSHGPTYYLRYPDAFEKFKPACQTAEFKKCTDQEITNSYDNTILYTDYILSQFTDLLASKDNLLTSLIYVSDHGESLGEAGLYLHGSPYFMAPEFQTKVPMIVWMSPEYQAQMGIDQPCLQAKSDQTFSHANLFHSVLGMLDIQTAERNQALDMFSNCKAN